LVALLVTVSSPVTLPLAFLYDVARGRVALPVCRTLLLALFGVWWECLGILASTGLWVVSGPWTGCKEEVYLRRNFHLQCLWGRGYALVGRFLFRLRVEVEAADAGFGDQPIILFMRHASSADTMLPVYLVSDPYGVRLRYVLKRELLWMPCLDIVGNRLPNYFVDRESDNIEEETARVGWLVKGLAKDEGVLIYPEGTRYTKKKRAHILKRLAEKGHARRLAQAEELDHVLPPKLGGALALLACNENADAVFCAHTGFEGSATPGSLLKGELIGKTVRVKFWRVPFAEIPATEEARIDWLYMQWGKVNTFVANHLEGDE
jgi:1-acyl-sn-glycerol-3-phosphate acyltransferase